LSPSHPDANTTAKGRPVFSWKTWTIRNQPMDRMTGQEIKFLAAFVGASRKDYLYNMVITEELAEFNIVNDNVTIWGV
jgi:hypothetical protein